MILVAGDLMLDIVLLSELRAQEQSTGIHVRSGGSAANTAAWMATLGLQVSFVGCIGDDIMGSMLVTELKQAGVRTRVRTVIGAETGAVAVQVGDDGERTMRSARGANQHLAPDDLLANASAPLSIVHLTGYALLGPFRFALLHAAGDIARACDAFLSFDPSSTGVIRFLGAERLLYEAATAGVDLLLPNCEEAEELTGVRGSIQAAEVLAARTPRVVVKDGQRGATWAAGDAAGEMSTQAQIPVDTTGAGDAFNAGVLAALSTGGSLADACRRGHEVATRAIALYGGRPPRKSA